MMKTDGSFSVEAAYVTSIVIFAVAIIITQAYKARDRVIYGYVTHEAAFDGAYSEENWDDIDSTPESAAEKAESFLHLTGRLSDASEEISTDGADVTAYMHGIAGEKEITSFINDTEEYMRMNTIVEDWGG